MEKNDLWIDAKMTEECMKFLWRAVSEEDKEKYSYNLAGNISKSELIEDDDNWFYKNVLKKYTEKMFYRDIRNKEVPLPKFKLSAFWVNYMKQYEFNPIHNHDGFCSFVVFMKIPTHWEEQHALPISVNSNTPSASNFSFVFSEKGSNQILNYQFLLSPEDEGRMLFFPSSLQHQVYPFYECEEERITLSGNIILEANED